jgi:hypothetical protein
MLYMCLMTCVLLQVNSCLDKENERHKESACQRRRKETFVTLSLTKIEVTGFNGLGSRIRDGEGHA